MTGNSHSLKKQKADMRLKAMARRAELFDQGHVPSARALEKYLNTNVSAGLEKVVTGYVPFGTEFDCMALLELFHQRGFIIGLPLVTAKAAPLTFLEFSPGDILIEGDFGIKTPAVDASVVVPSLLLVPLLAFDRSGYRLGYGGGFYDRTLEILRKIKPIRAIGLGFSGLEVDRVPHDELDQPLDSVLTERELIEIAAADRHPDPNHR